MGNSVVFIAYEERENLGVRYMVSVLSGAGYQVEVIDFRKSRPVILQVLQKQQPLLVGFSVVFEDHIYDFRDLAKYLRDQGIGHHFCAGGQFASLRPEVLFEIIPWLDSIVRFEGEHTILDLVNAIHSDTDWKEVTGISYMQNGTAIHNPLRPLEKDLDQFPFPQRPEASEYLLGKKYATLIAGRGCIYNCIFCNCREFYRLPPGPIKRIRDPARVAEEIEILQHEKDCSVFLFQDDDFPVSIGGKSSWIEQFCKNLADKHLSGKILWKINCRTDEVEAEVFEFMKHHGLFRVFLGFEEGTDSGLEWMNKKLTVSDHIRAVDILKDLGIGIEFGFMLFHPRTTYDSLRKNLRFLENISADGYMPVTFNKMLPYFETRIEKELKRTGRLKGNPGSLDYDLEPRSLNDLQAFVFDSFQHWLNPSHGLASMAKWAEICLSVFEYYFGTRKATKYLSGELVMLVADANRYMIHMLRTLSPLFERSDFSPVHSDELQQYSEEISKTQLDLNKHIQKIIGNTELLYLSRQLLT
jgi:radical SAM superfamily enzyme YgiQ (UPF0313 family)